MDKQQKNGTTLKKKITFLIFNEENEIFRISFAYYSNFQLYRRFSSTFMFPFSQ